MSLLTDSGLQLINHNIATGILQVDGVGWKKNSMLM